MAHACNARSRQLPHKPHSTKKKHTSGPVLAKLAISPRMLLKILLRRCTQAQVAHHLVELEGLLSDGVPMPNLQVARQASAPCASSAQQSHSVCNPRSSQVQIN